MFNNETKKYEGYIYRVYNKLNTMSYIGQTTTTVEKRWKRHVLSSKRSLELYFYEFIRIYGEDSFSVYIIEKISCDSINELHYMLDKLEKHYIEYYNTMIPNGYNVSCGGSNPPIISKGVIYQFDFDGNLLNQYDNIAIASDMTGIHAQNIGACCNGKTKYAGGYYWSRSKILSDEKIKEIKSSFVVKFDLNGNRLKEYPSIKDASREAYIKPYNISACCNGRQLTAGGYVWRHYGDMFDTYRIPNDRYNKTKKEVLCIENNIVFNSVNEAAKYCNVSPSRMSQVCNSKSNINGLHFKTLNDR